MNQLQEKIKFIIWDWFSASLAWAILFLFRKKILEQNNFSWDEFEVFDNNFYLGLLIIPLAWLLFYTLTGQYTNVLRKYRYHELGFTLGQSIIGVLIVFFVFLLDDQLHSYKDFYKTLLVLFFAHFFLTLIGRMLLTSNIVRKIHNKEVGFNTIIVGGNQQAKNMYDEILALKSYPGFDFKGFVRVNGNDTLLEEYMPYLGTYHNLPALIDEYEIEEVILAVESSDHEYLESIITLIEDKDVLMKIVPDRYDIVSGKVKMNSIFGVPLIKISKALMPTWQFTIKRAMDIVLSIIALLVLFPFLILIALGIKLTSKGSIFFSQERIGKLGKPFNIYKFRTMIPNAEKKGPQLSCSEDPRITKFGKFLRKTRLDELPQFWNVIIADMSLVGPRPERQHFIDLIMKEAPHYRHLQKVRPGITSWGQVKYGYAENVGEMVQRLQYDLLYIENMSIAMDIKILFYTISIVFRGLGK